MALVLLIDTIMPFACGDESGVGVHTLGEVSTCVNAYVSDPIVHSTSS